MRGDLAQVFIAAKRAHKKVFVLITDNTCGNCTALLENINRQQATRKILDREYICYEADIQNAQEHTIAEIVKCPSYPFPYFFDENGDLLAFGFPMSKEYKIDNLNNIKIDEERFTELFKLPISGSQYKKMVSMNLKATLLLDTNRQMSLALFKNSMDIAAYPYNIRYVNLLDRPLSVNDKISQALRVSAENASDQFLYGNIGNYVNIAGADDTDKQALDDNNIEDYSLSNNGEQGAIKKGVPHPFSFSVKNLSKTPLIILKVSHPCSCVKLFWPTTPVKMNETATVKGIFTPTASGGFLKEIFVHTNSAKNTMAVFKINGTVYE